MKQPASSAPDRVSAAISDAEWIVMKVVWNQGPVTANGVVEALAGRTDWKPKTIKTLLSRLVRKGAARFEKKGREYLFFARVPERLCVHAVSRSFLGRVFDGRLAPFLACFLEREQFSRAEIEELKQLLEEKK